VNLVWNSAGPSTSLSVHAVEASSDDVSDDSLEELADPLPVEPFVTVAGDDAGPVAGDGSVRVVGGAVSEDGGGITEVGGGVSAIRGGRRVRRVGGRGTQSVSVVSAVGGGPSSPDPASSAKSVLVFEDK
jgi:hypothetical protein